MFGLMFAFIPGVLADLNFVSCTFTQRWLVFLLLIPLEIASRGECVLPFLLEINFKSG